jgi:hypothetical protein
MVKQVKLDPAAVKIAKRLGVEPEKRPKFFELYESYKATSFSLKESYKDMQWLNGMMQIDGHTSIRALLHYDAYLLAVEAKHKQTGTLEAKLGGIVKSMVEMADAQKIIDDIIKALKNLK